MMSSPGARAAAVQAARAGELRPSLASLSSPLAQPPGYKPSLESTMDWQKELERSLSNVGASDSSLYEAHSSSSGQHFGSALPSLLQRQSSERSPWPGYRGAPQWPAQMAWMSQHRAHSQVWGDPSFRQFFSDHSQDLQAGQNIPGFRSPWETTNDVKAIENNISTTTAEQPVNYHTFSGGAGTESPMAGAGQYSESPASGTGSRSPPPAPGVCVSPDQGSERSADTSQGEEEANTPQQQGFSQVTPHPQAEDITEAEATDADIKSYSSQPGSNLYSPAVPSKHAPREESDLHDEDNLMDDDSQEMPKDLTRDKIDLSNGSDGQQHSYDVIRSMTAKYGDIIKEEDIDTKEEDTNCNRGATVDTAIKGPCISENNRESQSEFEEDQRELADSEDIYDFDSSEPRLGQKPIKLKIAKGEIVKNTALESEEKLIKPETETVQDSQVTVKKKPKSWAIEKEELMSLNLKLETDQILNKKVKDIVGEDVMNIFANAVEEAEMDSNEVIENKNVVFLYFAVKNSANLDIEEEKQKDLYPFSNLALSIPLLESLVGYIVKDNNMEENIQSKIGKDDLSFFESSTKRAVENNEEFWQDGESTRRMIFLYHSIRNLLLREIFSKLTTLYSKIEHILANVATDDRDYNAAVAQMTSLVIAPWNQQVIEAEGMKFNFEFLTQVFNFWKKVIAKRNKPEKKPKKPIKMKPLPTMKPSARSSRRRNEMVTYDEDIMQDCNIKMSMNQ